MIERKSLFHLEFYRHTCFHGSCLGMRYRIEKQSAEGTEDRFLVTVFPGPYGFDATPESEKETATFPFSEEGLDQACDFLNQAYARDPARWEEGKRIR